MKVLVACERSGRVRDALLRRGLEAVSCDVEPSDSDGPHILGRVEDVLGDDWDMVIGFPPCRFLSTAAGALCMEPWRRHRTFESALLFHAILGAAPRAAVENPRHHSLARQLIGPPTAVTEPWWFGDPWQKRTNWWLRGLQPLMPTARVTPRFRWVDSRRDNNAPGAHRDPYRRSLTPLGLAEAIADQWGDPAPQALL